MPRPNLEAAALDCIHDAIHGMGTLDLDALRDGAGDMASSAADEIEQATDALRDTAEGYGLEDPADPRVTSDCPHGWAAHDREDEAGTHFWTEGNLEGCRAVAVKVAGIWLSYTWTPEPAEEEGAE